VNSAVALSYFRNEITRRSQNQPINAKSSILTPDDVFNALQRHGLLPGSERNGNTQKQADRKPVPLQGRPPLTMDVRPEKRTAVLGGGTNQQSRTAQGTTAVKNSQSQMGQAWNGSSSQSPAAPNPPATAARTSSFATNSDSQNHKPKDIQLPQKRKDISVVIDSNASKRPKPNQNASPQYCPLKNLELTRARSRRAGASIHQTTFHDLLLFLTSVANLQVNVKCWLCI
jgi:hypothetical protein